MSVEDEGKARVRQRILAGTAFASYNDTVSHLTDEGMT
jgi:hypothetical protein